MDKAELIKRLKGYEWNDVEFKRAQGGVPDSAYETVSAFSNTDGGWLVFGIRDNAGGYEIVGVLEVDKVQNDFLSVLRSGQKLNRIIAVDERLIEDDGKALLVFHIPEARRQDKPIYLDRDIRKSFIRRGAGDERCTQTEIERLLRNAADERYDAGAVDLDPERCFDEESLRWYRKRFDGRNPKYDQTLSHMEFLHHWGLVAEAGGRLVPTRAAILLFGRAPAFRQLLPRPVVDLQWRRGDWSEELAGERWSDRLVVESNLVETWRVLLDRYLQRAEKPFSIDPKTLQRDDLPQDYVGFREAAINLLMHQNYADHTRKAAIRFFDNRAELWNPGDAYTSTDELLEPGDREVRNPRIVGAFRRIGLSEQAGTGMQAIFDNWRRLGYVPPIINNDRTRQAFQLTLPKKELLSEEQILFQAKLGVQLDDAEANAFAFACLYGRLGTHDVRAVAGLSGAGAQALLDRLASQGLISPLEGTGMRMFVLAEHLRELLGWTDQADHPTGAGVPSLITSQAGLESGRLVTDQAQSGQEDLSTTLAGRPSASLSTVQAARTTGSLVTAQVEPLLKLSANQRKIIGICDVPHSLAAIMNALGVAGRGYFKRRHLDPLLRGGVLRMTHPDQPKHPNQAYVLTEAGAKLKAADGDKDAAMVDGNRTNGA